MIYQFGKLAVKFEVCDSKIANNIQSEYSQLPHSVKNPDLSITFDTEAIGDCYPVQKLQATGRSFTIEYVNETKLHVCVPESTSFDWLFRTINPTYESRQSAAIIDFLHNLFLGILQVQLLKRESTIFHCGTLCMPGNNKAILLFGGPQIGKSTLINLLTENYWGKIISEDFCILSKEGLVYSLPHKRRISLSQYEKMGHCLNFAEWWNRNFCKFMRKEAYRVLPFSEIFNRHSFSLEAPIDIIYFVQRDGTVVFQEKCSKSEFTQKCLSVLVGEFKNFSGFEQMFDVLPGRTYAGMNFVQMVENTKQIIEAVYDRIDCRILHVPFLRTPEMSAEALRQFLIKKE